MSATRPTSATVADFLLARIAEREAAARAASPAPWEQGYSEDGYTLATHGYPEDRVVLTAPEPEDVDHVHLHAPDRVLAECAAHRAIVTEYRVAVLSYGEGLDRAVRHLAAAYADHPDYRPEYRP